MTETTLRPSRSLALGGLVLAACLCACGSDSNSGGTDAGKGGSGGKGGAGGLVGGQGGKGGNVGTGGTGTGGATGGTVGTGGAGGGGGAGGAGGAGGSGSGGAGGKDGGTDTPAPMDGGSPGDPNAFLDACFTGIRARVGDHQTSAKASADGSTRVRLALETGDGIGTSGTKAWRLIRFGLTQGDTRICIKEEAMLAGTYRGSHHNCADYVEVTVQGTTYRLDAPDTHPDRNKTTLRVLRGGAMISGPTALPTTSCTARGAVCQSGQPC